jgi:hypothetical protein
MQVDPYKLVTAFKCFTEACVLIAPLRKLERYRVDGSKTTFENVPQHLEGWYDIVALFHEGARKVDDLQHTDPGDMLEESRRLLRGILTRYENLDRQEGRRILALQSVQNWLDSHDDEKLLAMVHCIMDMGNEQMNAGVV